MARRTRHDPRSPSCGTVLSVLLCLALAACGGGGGGGGSGSASVTVFPATVSFIAYENDQSNESKSLTISWTGSNVAGIVVGTLPGVPTQPFWLGVSLPSVVSSPATLTLQRLPFTGLAPGSYSTTLRVVTGDANQKVIAQTDFSITLDVVAAPSVAPTSLSTSWVESEQPAAQQLTVTHTDPRVQPASATSNVPWLTATIAGDTVTVAGTAAARTVRPGQTSATVRVVFSLPGGGTRAIDVPVAANVSYALGGPAMSVIEFMVDGSTQAADLLNRTATISTATQTPVTFDVTSNVPWLTSGYGMTTGSPNNLLMQLQGNEIGQRTDGEYNGVLTITPVTPNITPVQIPVRLSLNLPEVHFVMPVAFTDTADTDYVLVHGRGLMSPNVDLRVDGATPQSATVLDDRTVRVVPGARAAGDYAVTVSNRLGYDRGSTTLRVTDPPAYGPFSLDAAVGLQERILSSPINRAVFTSKCYFCNVFSTGTLSTIQRFAYDAGMAQWTRTEKLQSGLIDIALTPDQSKLIVLTSSQLLLADPVSLVAQPADTFTLPSPVLGIAYQLAVAGDGLVIIGDSTQAFSLRSRTFVDMPSNYVLGRAPVASGDGSRVLLPYAPDGGSLNLQAYDPSTGTIVDSSAVAPDPRTTVNRHATTAFSAGSVLNADFSVRGRLTPYTGAVSPDGTRLYYPDLSTSDVRVFDITASSTFGNELLPAIDVPGVPNDRVARLAVDPRGKHVFYVTENKFVVLVLP